MLIGALFVLLTWAIACVLLTGTGVLMTHLIAPTARGLPLLRSSMWWGLGITTLVTLAIGLTLPLGSSTAAVVMGGLLLTGAVGGAILFTRRLPVRSTRRPSLGVWLLLGALAALVAYLSYKTLGPATNYDTGLYHYGFIRYFGEYGTVPGLANLFLPFGYSNAQFPLASLLTSTPWGVEGWRLLNGFLVVLVVLELVIRLFERRWTWGTFVLVVGLAGVSLPLVAMADSLVTSPTADTAVLMLTLVSAAYLCDLLEDAARTRSTTTSRLALDLGLIVITTGLTIAMRPTMIAYAVGMGVVLLAVGWRNAPLRALPRRAWTVPGAWLLLLGTVQVYRDYLLSGWLLYPLSIFRWDVPWAGRDPTPLRDATLAAARDPSAADGYVVAHSWEWIGAWLGRLPVQWEPWFLLAGLVILAVVGLWARATAGFPRRPRTLLLALVPGTLATLAWFLASPPSFRFIWGPLFTLVFITVGAAFIALHRSGRSAAPPLLAAAGVILAVTAFSAGFRNLAPSYSETGAFAVGGWHVDYAYAPLPVVSTTPVRMITGLVVQVPDSGDQCWANYPLCTVSMGDRIGLLGESIGDGFVTVP